MEKLYVKLICNYPFARLNSKVCAHFYLLILSWNVDDNINISYRRWIEKPRHVVTLVSHSFFFFLFWKLTPKFYEYMSFAERQESNISENCISNSAGKRACTLLARPNSVLLKCFKTCKWWLYSYLLHSQSMYFGEQIFMKT